MILVAAAWAGAIALGEPGIAVATGGALAVVDPATGQAVWSVPTGTVPIDGLGWVGTRLWAFGQQGAWAFEGGRLVEAHGDVIDGAGPTRVVTVGKRVWLETPDQLVAVEDGRVVERRAATHLGADGRTSDTGWPVTAGEIGADMVLRAGGKVLAVLPGQELLASGPAGYVAGPDPVFVAADGRVRAAFDPAEGFAVATDTVYSARDGELRAFALDGKTRWRLAIKATAPVVDGITVVGLRSTLVIDPATGALRGGWIGAAEPEVEAAAGKARAVATVSGNRLTSTEMVGKGRKRKPAWVVELAAGERPNDLRGPIVLVAPNRWRVLDPRSGKQTAAGVGTLKERLPGGWLKVDDAGKVSLVKLATGEVTTFQGKPDVVGVLADGRVVLIDTALRVVGDKGWTALAPAHAVVAADLVLAQIDGVLYALRDGAILWAVPFTEELRGVR